MQLMHVLDAIVVIVFVCQRNIVVHLIQQNDKETTKWYPLRVVNKRYPGLVFNKNSVVIYTDLDEKKKVPWICLIFEYKEKIFYSVIILSIKGQLISKCLFGVIVWTKNQRKNYQNFCFSLYRTEILVIFTLVFCPNDDTKKTFWN